MFFCIPLWLAKRLTDVCGSRFTYAVPNESECECGGRVCSRMLVSGLHTEQLNSRYTDCGLPSNCLLSAVVTNKLPPTSILVWAKSFGAAGLVVGQAIIQSSLVEKTAKTCAVRKRAGN